MADTQIEEAARTWLQAKSIIKPQVAALVFTKWFDTLTAVTVYNSILILEAKDEVTRETLKTYYFDYLRQALAKVSPSILDVMLILPGQRGEFIKKQATVDVILNPSFTFDTFVVGNSNLFAHGAALAVAQKPGTVYNPLFLYGGVGLGKTHLMHAIGHEVLRNNPHAKVMYCSSESFTNEFIDALRLGKTLDFRLKYRYVDLLMIDDVQFLSNKQSTLEEFFNTFNELHSGGKQIVISSDRPPKELVAVDERLISRFEWGLVADIQEPDLETRMAILKNRAQMERIVISNDALQFIAERVQSNIRTLEGCLNRVVMFARLKHQPLDLELAREALKDLLPQQEKHEVSPSLIKETVAEYWGVTQDAMLSQRRDKEVVIPRQVAMYLCHEMLGLPYKRISQLFGKDDHTTAMNACERIQKAMAADPDFCQRVKDVQKRLQ